MPQVDKQQQHEPTRLKALRGRNVSFSEAPQADGNALTAADLVPAELLDGGEIVLLAIKPSLWFVVFRSARWVTGMILVMLLSEWLGSSLNLAPALIVKTALALAAARVGFAMLQWVSRLYVLTNRRIMRMRGIFNIDLFECSLLKIQNTYLSVAWYERLMGLGTISFATAGSGEVEVSWLHVNEPLEVHERVRSAIHKAQRHRNGM